MSELVTSSVIFMSLGVCVCALLKCMFRQYEKRSYLTVF